MCSCEFVKLEHINSNGFAERVRELSAEFGIHAVSEMARVMGMPLSNVERIVDPHMSRYREPTPWFQKMFLKLYRQKLEQLPARN